MNYSEDFNAYIMQYMNEPIVLHHLHEHTSIFTYIYIHHIYNLTSINVQSIYSLCTCMGMHKEHKASTLFPHIDYNSQIQLLLVQY